MVGLKSYSSHLSNLILCLKSFRSRREGGTAVEFALVIWPLIMLILGTLEMALIILLSVTLENATSSAARKIRTGLTTQANSSANVFKQEICNGMGWLELTCMSDLVVDIKTYNNFSEVPTTDPIVSGALDVGSFSYTVGAGSTIQLVRAYYQWPLISPFLEGGLTKLSSGDVIVSSKIVFRNEPF